MRALNRKFPSNIPKGKVPKRKLPSESYQAKVSKRTFLSESSQAKDPKRKFPSERSHTDDPKRTIPNQRCQPLFCQSKCLTGRLPSHSAIDVHTHTHFLTLQTQSMCDSHSNGSSWDKPRKTYSCWGKPRYIASPLYGASFWSLRRLIVCYVFQPVEL